MLFPQLQGKCQGRTRKDGARPALFQSFVFYVLFVLSRSVYCLCVIVHCTTATGWLPKLLCCSMYCLFCVVLCIVCVCARACLCNCALYYCHRVATKIVVLFYVLFVLCRSVYFVCVRVRACVIVYCTTATGWLPNCS